MSRNDGNATCLDSDLLRTFLAVAVAGSVTGGAERLFRTQSAVSLQVQKLERVVGHRLFERHGRGIAMTDAGERLLPVARQVVGTLDQALSAMRGEQAVAEIRLGFPEEYADTILPRVLAAFAHRQPSVRLLLRCGASTEFPRLLAEGGLDLALHSPERSAAGDVVVRQEAAVWAGSIYHQLHERRPVPVALFDRSCWWRDRCLDLLRQSGLEHRVVCASESVAGVRAAVAAGIAVGVLPRSTLTPDLRVLEPGTLPDIGTASLVLTRASAAPNTPAAALAAVIAEAFG